ncbi:putative udp-glucoronosyl and udp-glucosyl transferase family protein [Rosellinia necatrix]|uniref:Putative udp-glucoronosyl and udp-glucosyl transferase family protein n=1 Tax=Rosellinia necatrix TaxID=77044 RepID=A0A1S7UK44_ROSNE|nr:putative udp-glucoronosyl and udp-glucosyl transferase family protein [Rosellinia necatrix]
MLQRPRNILKSHHNCPRRAQAASDSAYSNSNTFALNTPLVKFCQPNYSPWDKALTQLAVKWVKTSAKRRSHNLRRSMVKRPTLRNTTTSDPVGSGTKDISPVVKRDPAHGGPCPRESDICKEASNQAYVGKDQGSSSDCGLAENTDSMEQKKEVIGTQRSINGRQDRVGERTLTIEEYIAHRRRVAIAKLMVKFQNWLDKRLAIISYTIQTSDASGETGGDARNAGSQSPDMSDNKPKGTSNRPKRQLSDNDDSDDVPSGGDDNGRDRGGNKRAKMDADPEEVKLACPFHKHNPKAHRKDGCIKGAWKTIHRLKEHLYRVHLLPKHNCPRCNSCFENDKELQTHLRADDPCKKSNVAREEGIDQDTERKLRERKKYNSCQTESQRWNDIYLLLFPGADRNAIPSPYPEAATPSKNFERYQRVEKRIKKELPELVKRRVETTFEKTEADLLHGLNDIVRSCLADFFRNSMSQEEGSSATTSKTASRATSPGLVSLEEPCAESVATTLEPLVDVDYLLSDPEFGFGSEHCMFDFNPPFTFECGPDGYVADKALSDSGYASTGNSIAF